MRKFDWEPVTGRSLIGFGLGFGIFLAALFLSEPGFIPLLDHANLVFHEAGHPIVGLFNSRLEPYGGTLGQLAIPLAVCLACWRQGQSIGLAAAVIWFSENFFNIARYVADARALQLPLVGGGMHDWNNILDRWDIMHYDLQIASALKVAGWIGIALACVWVAWRAWKTRIREGQGLEADTLTPD